MSFDHVWIPQKGVCCDHEKCVVCGAVRKTKTCEFHKLSQLKYDWSYFWRKELGAFIEGVPQNKGTELEHLEVFKELHVDLKSLGKSMLEVGAGTGKLVPMFLKAGFDYEALEISDWACNYLESAYNVKVHNYPIEEFKPGKLYDFVVCIHSLEHFEHADVVFEQLKNLVRPGGYLFIEVPDDTDLYNPDHYWFFNKSVLQSWGKTIGLSLVGFAERKIVERENYLYFLFQMVED